MSTSNNSPEKSEIDSSSDVNLPGYPHYPPSDDLLAQHELKRDTTDTENLPASGKSASTPSNTMTEEFFNVDQITGSEETIPSLGPNDITPDDLLALGDINLAMDGGDDEQLLNRVHPLDATAGDLDIPGSELDDAAEAIGEEDEENNFYSLGGDQHDQ